jgi:hypothetical protein
MYHPMIRIRIAIVSVDYFHPMMIVVVDCVDVYVVV